MEMSVLILNMHISMFVQACEACYLNVSRVSVISDSLVSTEMRSEMIGCCLWDYDWREV